LNPKTYKELADAWHVDKKYLYQAKTANAEALTEGKDFTTNERGEMLWFPSGQAILARSLNLNIEIEGLEPETFDPDLDPLQEVSTLAAGQVCSAIADRAALQAWQQLPQMVVASMRRMLHAPSSEAEASAVATALNALVNGGGLAALPNPEGE